MFKLFNETDQVYAAPMRFPTEAAAEEYAREFRKRFNVQGYYLTADGYRISPENVELMVVPADS